MKKTNDLEFIGNDPGAVKHGNFINYYSFHTAKQRIDRLLPIMFQDIEANQTITCLDVGCNSGDLTKELYVYLKENVYPDYNIQILGIDIDPILIDRAEEAYTDDALTFITCNVMDKADRVIIDKYLASHKKEKFDIVFCFSVTMWIHINNGDEGLMKFLKYLKQIAKTIILEPQPWRCYRNAQKRIRKSSINYSKYDMYPSLKIRQDVDVIIEKCMSETHVKMHESSESQWHRKIQSYW